MQIMKEQKKSRAKPGAGKHKDLSKEIFKIKANNPNLSGKQIGEIVGCSKQNVNQMLKRHGIKQNAVTDFRKLRADILSHYQNKVLENIDKKKLDSANIQQLLTAFGILYDKERLETNKSTHNFALANLTQLIDKDATL